MPTYPIKWPPLLQIAVVLCIIVFMSAVLFPVFQKVHEYSGPGCSSNMKQLGFAYSQYEQAYDGNYPPGAGSTGNGWAGQIYYNVHSRRSYRCRNDPQNGNYISYAENQNLAGHKLADLVNPFSTVELYEFSTLNCDPSTHETVSATGLSAPQNSTRHDSGAPQAYYSLNFLSADGSVKFLSPQQISGGTEAVSPTKLPQGRVVKTFAVK